MGARNRPTETPRTEPKRPTTVTITGKDDGLVFPGTPPPAGLSLVSNGGPGSRRERKARRETDAAHDRLTVQARLAVVSARKLTTAELDDLFECALPRAKGDGHVANAAFAQLMALAHAALTGGDESTEGVNWADMTAEQRAVARVEIERRLAELAIEATEARDGDVRPRAK